MKISDRDKKLIIFVLLVAIVALPIVFFIKPQTDKTKAMVAESESLNDRYDQLKALSEKQEDYEKKIVELNAQRDEMIKLFPGDILKENTVMFLRRIETSDHPMWFSTISFGEYNEDPITDSDVNSEGNYEAGLTAVKLPTTVTFEGEYEDVKSMLGYIFEYDDKMIISSISMDCNKTNNKIEGTMIFDQFAVTGADNSVKDANIPNMLHGTDRVFPDYPVEGEEEAEETEE